MPTNLNILCVDMEDWYHPEYVKPKVLGYAGPRIFQSLKNTLNFLDQYKTKATFFIVGEIAENFPDLVDKIKKNGHEVAFHGYYHEPLWQMSSEKFSLELQKYNKLIESITGDCCLGFRAPSYSLDNRSKWAIDALEREGYLYDSSIFPIKTPLYGEASAPITPYHPSSIDITQTDDNQKLIEFPALVYPIAGFKIPAAGGFYLRSLPLFLLKNAIEKMNKNGFPAIFTFHTWELDPDTPRLRLGLLKSFVTYHNVPAFEKLAKIVSAYTFTNFKAYLEKTIL